MRVLLVTHYFPPEVGAPQARLSETARQWAADGLAVTVLTGMPNHPTGVIPVDYRKAVFRDERRDGCRVVRTWLYATANEGAPVEADRQIAQGRHHGGSVVGPDLGEVPGGRGGFVDQGRTRALNDRASGPRGSGFADDGSTWTGNHV